MVITQINEGKMPVVRVEGIEYLDVNKTFDCGQCFRFDRVEHSAHEAEFAGVAFGKYVSFASDGSVLYIYNSDTEDFERIWRPFLCLDMDYSAVDADIVSNSASDVMRAAMEYGRGIRILKQQPYEALVSFIISQNNNIPRIKKIIEALCTRCGERIVLPDEMKAHLSPASCGCTFPDCRAVEQLGIEGLTELKTGFRAKYIYGAVEKLCKDELDLSAVFEYTDTSACIDELCKIKGVGLKVASCAALFGLARYDAFPVDVWMKRVAQKYFPEDTDFNGKRFGKYAGIAQQYLFYYERYRGE